MRAYLRIKPIIVITNTAAPKHTHAEDKLRTNEH